MLATAKNEQKKSTFAYSNQPLQKIKDPFTYKRPNWEDNLDP